MLIFILIVVNGFTCQENIDLTLSKELLPRYYSFREKGVGLDYFSDFQECLESKLTYATVFWDVQGIPWASFGFCVPSNCSYLEAKSHIKNFLSQNQIGEIKDPIQHVGPLIHLKDLSETTPKPKVLYFFVLSFLILMTLNILGTISTFISNQNSFLKNFSVIKNFQALINRPKSEESLYFIDGIRALAATSLVFLHCIFFHVFFPFENRYEMSKFMTELPFNIIYSLTISVDIFFILSGFLMSYLTLKEINRKKQSFSWKVYFIRRLFRYLPIMFFLVGLERTTYGEIPRVLQMYLTFVASQDFGYYWVHCLLLVHNQFATDRPLYLGWTWTTSIDFQFHIMGSFVLHLYRKNKTLSYLLSLFYIICSTLYTTVVSNEYGFTPLISGQINGLQMSMIYLKLITRISPFIIGLTLGFIYSNSIRTKGESIAYEHKDSYGELFENLCLRVVNSRNTRWILYAVGAWFLFISSAGGLLAFYYLGENNVPQIFKSLWLGLHRAVFSIGFSFYMLGLLLGNNRVLNSMLKMRAFNFISKISNSLYNIHLLVFICMFLSGNELYRWNFYEALFVFFRFYLASVLVSVIIQVFIEAPFLNLARNYLGR